MITGDTIAAVATAPGMGAIAVIRLSGPDAIAMTDRMLFRHTRTGAAQRIPCGLAGKPAYTMHHGDLYDADELLDEVMVSLFRAPRSYTGEDTVEIACHGSVQVQQRLLQALVRHGARLAGPGEFSMRAFLNGKMDLAEAEGVADLIASENDDARRVALRQMRGGFSDELHRLREKMLELVALMELELDFSEEDVEFADRSELLRLVSDTDTALERLIRSFAYGNAIRQGIPTVIAGRTNVGKSTLLNALLHEDRAIVSDIDGTTRDLVEDCITLNGLTFRFIDTAGLRQTDDTVERLGIERTLRSIHKARFVLLVVDAQRTPEDWLDQLQALRRDPQTDPQTDILLVVNKCDCLSPADLETKTARFRRMTADGVAAPAADAPSRHAVPETGTGKRTEATVRTQSDDAPQPGIETDGTCAAPDLITLSAKQREGILALEDALCGRVRRPASDSSVIVTNLRHYEALCAARTALRRVSDGLAASLSSELLSGDIREVLHHLGAITGEISEEDILGVVFSRFCIGK